MLNLALLLGLLLSPPAVRSASPVEAELHIPPAEAYVIGDVIPLFWRFRNVSDEPLAFMWEGCCRLNGRLSATRGGQTLPPVPPGQALAHMFAKAERLEPGQARDFDTRLEDWVKLPETGTYELQGRYTGVLPDQRPQVARGLKLWRDAAQTGPIQVSVLSVDDYTGQRAARETRRGLRLVLEGPARLPPLVPTPLRLRIENVSNEPQSVAWPDALDLWVVDQQGHRVVTGGTALEGDYALIPIAPGAHLEREVAFSSDHLEGEIFGTYQVFVDLRSEGANQPRVPSNALPIQWQLDPPQLRQLLVEASRSQRPTARNPHLRLLRVYLTDLARQVDVLTREALSDEARTLLGQLQLAACLKPVAPKPGRAEIGLAIGTTSRLSFTDPTLSACLAGNASPPPPLLQQLSTLLSLRRHLGWDVGLVLLPEPTTTARQVFEAVGELASVQRELSIPLRVMPGLSTNLFAGALVPGDALPRPDLGLLCRTQGTQTTLFLIGALASTNAPPLLENLRSAVQTAATPAPTLTELSDPGALETWLRNHPSSAPRSYVLAAGGTSMRALFQGLEPALARGLQITLSLLP